MERQAEKITSLWHRILPSFFLAFITNLVYYPSLNYEFQFDDIANITKHFKIRHYGLSDLFFSGTRWISYWLNALHYKIGKFEPFSYRLGNVIIHSINGLLIFFILLAALNKLPQKSFFTRNSFVLSFLTSLLFLLHPVQTQTISYVIQGKLEGLAALASLGMTFLFLHFNYSRNQLMRVTYLFLFFSLAIFATGTKEIAIVTPFLILLIDWFFVAYGSFSSLKKRSIFHLLNSFMVIGSYIYLLKPKFFLDLFSLNLAVGNNIGNIITTSQKDLITPYYFFISQFKVLLHYLWIFIWPFNISVEYDWTLAKSFFAIDCILPFVAVVIVGFATYKLLQQNRISLIGFAALWFILNILPRSSIIPSPELIVDYKTYLASFGWLFIIAAFLVKIFEQLKRYNNSFQVITHHYYGSHGLIVILICLLSLGTFHRNKVWRSGIEFWANIINNAPGKARAYNNYGVELSQNLKKFSEAIPYFQHAIKLDKYYKDPYNNLAVAYAANHQIDKAIETLQMSLRINAQYPEAYNNIALFLLEKKDYEKAEIALQHAIHYRPYYGKAHFNLGRLYMEQGEYQKAYKSFKTACMEADLDNEIGFSGYANCCLCIKQYDEAIFACKKVLEFNPQNYDATFNLANAYYLVKNFNNACHIYKGLLATHPHDPKIWYNLAEAHFSAQRIQEALYCFKRLQHNPAMFPNVIIRIAACYEKLEKPDLAKISLEQLLQQKLSQKEKESVTTALQKLIEQYQLV